MGAALRYYETLRKFCLCISIQGAGPGRLGVLCVSGDSVFFANEIAFFHKDAGSAMGVFNVEEGGSGLQTFISAVGAA